MELLYLFTDFSARHLTTQCGTAIDESF